MEDHLALVEFTYNNSYHSSIGMAPFEALYGRPCPSPLSWSGPGQKFVVGLETVKEMNDQVATIRHLMQVARIRQNNYNDRRRRALEFQVGDKVFL